MPYKQDNRMCVVTSPLGKDVLILRSMTVDEGVSELFRIQLDLVSHKEEIKFADIIGKPVSVAVHLASGDVRHFHGVVSRFTQGGSYSVGGDEKGLVSYQAELVPWLWNLTRSTNCRVWEKKSVVDIVKDVFGKLGFSDYEFSTSGTYDPIEYCVQYRETDFNFVSRMMEEEGLGYAFRHENDKHTMEIFDTSTSCPDCPGAKTLTFGGASGTVGSESEVDELTVSQVMPAGKYALNGYDFTSPSDDLLAPTQTAVALGGNSKYEIYDSPSNYTASSQGSRYVKLRMEAEEAGSHQAFGRSSCPALTCGQHFTLKNHFRDSLNQRYFLTRVHHTVAETVGYEQVESNYENSFTCLPDSIPYRPLQRTPKPTIPGTQTALVVGPKGEEIHTDKYGRVRVQFYWDRGGKRDGSDVVWVRVAHAAAGKKWGGLFIPRIGQEVVVTFVDGDPDRPLITGVVYNAEQMPPYDLPASKTQSGFKSRSSKSGAADNYNEISFDDKKGNEALTIHAEKDMSTTVKHDQNLKVKNNRSISVDGTHTETIKKDTGITITEGNYKHVVAKGNSTVNVDTGTFTHKVKGAVSETFLATQTTTVTNLLTVEGKASILIKAADEIKLQVGAHFISIRKDGQITVSSDKILNTAGTEAKIGVGNQSVTCDKQKVATSGAAINSSAVGMHEIAGAVVKIN